MKHFTRIQDGKTTDHYITAIRDGLVYYGHYKPGHENKTATAVMTLDYFNKLKNKTFPEILV